MGVSYGLGDGRRMQAASAESVVDGVEPRGALPMPPTDSGETDSPCGARDALSSKRGAVCSGRGHMSLNPISSQSLPVLFIYLLGTGQKKNSWQLPSALQVSKVRDNRVRGNVWSPHTQSGPPSFTHT